MKPQEEFSDNENSIYAVLKTGNANKLNLCAAIFSIVKKAKDSDKSSLIKFTAEQIENVETNKQVNFEDGLIPINDNEKERLQEVYGKISDEMLNALVGQNLEVNEFYKQLWEVINNPFFNKPNAKEYVFYNILMDNQIPYFHVDEGLKMANDEFKGINENIYTLRAEARFILKRKFDQRTQQASNLIDLFDKVENKDEKIVLMAYLLSQTESKEMEFLKALKSARS
jgi:hypothetical protein